MCKKRVKVFISMLLLVTLVTMSLEMGVKAEETEQYANEFTAEEKGAEDISVSDEGDMQVEGNSESADGDSSTNEEDMSEESADEPEEKLQYDENEKKEIESRLPDVITGMNELGEVYSLDSANGVVNESLRTRAITAQIVNLNTKGSSGLTYYTEVETGEEGYICGAYGADAAYLGTVNGKVRFMLAGVIGEVNASEVQVVNGSSVKSISHYVVSNKKLLHKITTNMNNTTYGSTLDQGNAPSYLKEGTKYYSYDGHYFYSEENYGTMLNDYKSGTRKNAVNANEPYYNYFQFLPFRSVSSYQGSTLNSIINGRVSGTSKMRDLGNALVNLQNTYGVNALLMTGVAANESAWGTSRIAREKNNLFGLNAVDSSPGQSSTYYSSVEQCVKEYAEIHMSKQYLNPENWKYFGAYLGNKASGINLKYASDPYWGEKAANIAWVLDRENGRNDVGKYTLGIKDVINSEHTALNVRKEATTASTKLYGTGQQSSYAFIILGESGGFYKIQSDPVLNSSRTAIDSNTGVYNFSSMYAFASKDYITKINVPTGGWTAEITTNVASPQTMGTEIKLSAKVNGSATGLQYKFVWMKDNWKEWGVIKDFSATASVNWKPSGQGDYVLYLNVKDATGKTETVSVDYQIVNWGVKGINTDLISPQPKGTVITLMPLVMGDSSGLQYKFVWMKDNWKNWGVIKDFSTSTKAEWKPSEVGDYQIIVDVKDKNGVKVSKSIFYEIANKTWSFTGISTDKKSGQVLGTSINITANVKNAGTNLKYKFVWMKDDWKSWGVIQDFTKNKSVTWTPEGIGTYNIYVDVSDGNSENTEHLNIPYKIIQGEWKITDINTNPENSQKFGNPIEIIPQISGNAAGLRYKYVWEKNNWAQWGVISDFSNSAKKTWTPGGAGKYKLIVDVKDLSGKVQTFTISYEVFEKEWKLETITANQYSPQEIGKSIVVYPKVSGKTDNLEYKFVWQKDNWGSWGVIQEFSEKSSATWKTDKPGEYTIYVDVREKGKSNTETKSMPFQIVRGNWSVGGIYFDLVSPQIAGKNIGVAAEIIGNTTGLQYKFVWQLNDWAEWGVIQEKSSDSKALWIPQKAGNYKIYLDVIDSFGNKTTIYKEYEVIPWRIRVTPNEGVTGRNTTISVEGISNNKNLQYKYVWEKNNWSQWGVIAEFSNEQSVKWTPKEAGEYTLYVDFKDKSTNKVETKTVSYKVK
ncbi:triple tyrosine motif-containing protein [Roseburia hominis]